MIQRTFHWPSKYRSGIEEIKKYSKMTLTTTNKKAADKYDGPLFLKITTEQELRCCTVKAEIHPI